jgi:uncharacterized protein YjbJ (UPF0337 family)
MGKGAVAVKESTKDRLEGAGHEVKGTLKKQAGQIVNNRNLVAEGQDENAAGKIRTKVGQVERALGN